MTRNSTNLSGKTISRNASSIKKQKTKQTNQKNCGCYGAVIPALGKLRQEDHEFKASLHCTTNLRLAWATRDAFRKEKVAIHPLRREERVGKRRDREVLELLGCLLYFITKSTCGLQRWLGWSRQLLTALVGDPSSDPSTHMVFYNCLELQCQEIQCPLWSL